MVIREGSVHTSPVPSSSVSEMVNTGQSGTAREGRRSQGRFPDTDPSIVNDILVTFVLGLPPQYVCFVHFLLASSSAPFTPPREQRKSGGTHQQCRHRWRS